MKITVTTTDDKIFFLDVAEDLELENLKALCAMEIGSEVGQIMVIFNGRELSNDKNTLKQFGVRDGDCIVLERRRSNPNRIGEYPHHPPQRVTRCARVGLYDNESGSLNALSLSPFLRRPFLARGAAAVHHMPASGRVCASVCEFLLEEKNLQLYK